MIGIRIPNTKLRASNACQDSTNSAIITLMRTFEVIVENTESLTNLLAIVEERHGNSSNLDLHLILDESISPDFVITYFRKGLKTIFLRLGKVEPRMLESIPPHHRGACMNWRELSTFASTRAETSSNLMEKVRTLLLVGWNEETTREEDNMTEMIEKVIAIRSFNPQLKVYLEVLGNIPANQLRMLLINDIHPVLSLTTNDLQDPHHLIDSFVNILDFQKNDGLIPTIVQDARTHQVLMLAYSNRRSLKEALTLGRGVYYSRSRQQLWIKGQTSGNKQNLIRALPDCDLDAVLFLVEQEGVACHLNRYACFGERQFTLAELLDTLKQRMATNAPHSYTARVARDEQVLLAKIREECEEVINHQDRANLTWELADLYYFTLVLMAKKDITLEEVINELERRKK